MRSRIKYLNDIIAVTNGQELFLEKNRLPMYQEPTEKEYTRDYETIKRLLRDLTTSTEKLESTQQRYDAEYRALVRSTREN